MHNLEAQLGSEFFLADSYNDVDSSKIKVLNASPKPATAEDMTLEKILEYQNSKFLLIKKDLKRRYNSLSKDLRSQYPFFETLDEYLASDSESGYLVAQINESRLYKNTKVLKLCDETRVYSSVVKTMLKPELGQQGYKGKLYEYELILDLLTRYYKKDYEGPKRSYSTWPIKKMGSHVLSYEEYLLKRYDTLYELLTPGLIMGVFLTKIKKKKPLQEDALTFNELQTTLNLLDQQEPSYIHLVEFPGFFPGTWSSTSDHKVLLVSDIHVGSLTHCAENFSSLILRCNQDPKIKYFIANGDLIDGINVYPNQKNDLLLKDYVAQYSSLASTLNNLREDITIVLSPGNHDFISKVEPQSFSVDIKKIILKGCPNKKILFVPNPSHLWIEGIYFYLSHGTGQTAIINKIPLFDVSNTTDVLSYAMDCRYVNPIIDYAPIRATEIVYHYIPDEVNVITTGHVHNQQIFKYDDTRLLVCTGTFQNLTSYMDVLGIKPTVSSVVVINLENIDQTEEWDLKDKTTQYYTYNIARTRLAESKSTE